tara:strand:- start:47432 stop:47821 length:390 start_codon:yes stop_codon:yes gene_type:complete
MKNKTLQQFLLIAAIGLFSQFSVAQDANSAGVKQIADIVVSLNHFPNAADKATLAAISGDMALAQGVRDMASAVSNIQHAATAEGKAAMATIQGNDQAPDRAKNLAGIISNFSHMASADAKTQLAELFP